MVCSARLSSFVAALCVPLALASHAYAQSGPSRIWTAQSVTGEVRVERPGAVPAMLKAGDTVTAGATIEARGNARAVMTRDGGDTFTLSPDSAVQVAETGGTATKLLQKLGTALFKVTTRPSWSFEVETPYMVALVKGTSFTVSVRNEGAAVQVIEGAVQVARPDGRDAALLRPGQTATARPGAGISVGDTKTPAPTEKRGDAKEKLDNAPAEKSDAGKRQTARIEQKIGAEVPDFTKVTGNLVENGGRRHQQTHRANPKPVSDAGAVAEVKKAKEVQFSQRKNVAILGGTNAGGNSNQGNGGGHITVNNGGQNNGNGGGQSNGNGGQNNGGGGGQNNGGGNNGNGGGNGNGNKKK